jgi:hypothetical protein
MTLPSTRIGLWALLVLAIASSCAVVHSPGKSPLVRPQMSADSVVLEIFFVRVPFGKEEANGPLWEEVDEQHLPAEARRQLAQSGFRAGVVAGQMPTTLSQLMELNDKPAPREADVQKVGLEQMQSEPRVVRRHLQCRTGQRNEILTSDVYNELPVLMSESGGLCGQTYARAQGLLAVKTFPLPDGRVRLDLLPELHYGEPRQRFVGDQGALRLESGRPRRGFENLAFSVTLAPGHMLLVSCLPSRPGSLGHHFFTTVNGGQKEQKLLIIRLAQTQHDGLFEPDAVLPLEGDGPDAPMPPAEAAPAKASPTKGKEKEKGRQ